MGWEQLSEMLRQNMDAKYQVDSAPPDVCPIDGTFLDIHPDGRRNCPMGNYAWPTYRTRIIE